MGGAKFCWKDICASISRFNKDNLAADCALVEQIKVLAAVEDCTLGQIALAWLLAHATFIVPILDTRSPNRIAENAAITMIALSADELANLNTLVPRFGVHSERYNNFHLKLVNG